MKFWFDTEFIEDGKTIDLISIGIVAEDGREYYAISSEYDASKADPWVHENVLRHLRDDEPRKPRAQIAEEVVAFVGYEPEFWAYYADYDWVVLCQLFGRMVDLPKGWTKYCRDLKQWIDEMPGARAAVTAQSGTEHRAIDDARWVREAWTVVKQLRTNAAIRMLSEDTIGAAALEQAIRGNRAGDNESELTKDQLMDKYTARNQPHNGAA